MIPEVPRQIRARLEELGVRPRKRLGQSFLADPKIRDVIVAAAEVLPGDFVLEVGPGLGTLTRGLLDAGAQVLAVEIDPVLAGHLEEEFREEPRFSLLTCDALLRGELAPEVREAIERGRDGAGRFLVVANLPYSAATPVIASLARDPSPPELLVVMVQKEVADRMTGRPGSSDYGPLSVLLSLAGHARILREVSGTVFVPRVRVRSAVVEFRFVPTDSVKLSLGDGLARKAFLYRRKSVRKALELSGYARERIEAALAARGIEPSRRPETLTPEDYVALAEAFSAGAVPSGSSPSGGHPPS